MIENTKAVATCSKIPGSCPSRKKLIHVTYSGRLILLSFKRNDDEYVKSTIWSVHEMKSLILEDGKCICKKSLKVHHKQSMNASQPSYGLENQFCPLTNSPNNSSVKFWQGKGPHAPEQIHAREASFQGPLKNSSDDSWFYLPTPCSVLGAAIPPAKPETKGRLVIVDP